MPEVQYDPGLAPYKAPPNEPLPRAASHHTRELPGYGNDASDEEAVDGKCAQERGYRQLATAQDRGQRQQAACDE
jgi:hypothetical protein